jgi:alpha-N-acetylglucosamine transferase
MKIIKAYTQHFEKQDLIHREMGNRVVEMQQKVEIFRAEAAELKIRESVIDEQKSHQLRQISRLNAVVDSVKEHQSIEKNVGKIINEMVEASSDWSEHSTILGDKVTALKSLLQQRSSNVHNELELTSVELTQL